MYKILAYTGSGRHIRKSFDASFSDQGKVQSEIRRLRALTKGKRISSIYVNDKRVYPA